MSGSEAACREAAARCLKFAWFFVEWDPQKGPLLNPLVALLNWDLIQRVYIPKGPPNPIP